MLLITFQVMLFTRNMELQNGVLCLEPISRKSSKTTEAAFVACSSSKEQKWNYIKTDENGTKGKIVHQASGTCLSFNKHKENSQDPKYNKVKMLAFLSNIVNEIGINIVTPVIEPCEQKTDSQRYGAQVWSMDSPVNLDGL